MTAPSLTLASGATVTSILDEDGFGSNSDTALATQQSIKAYVDAQLTASDLDFQGDSGGALSIDLDSETLTIAGGTGIDTSGSSNTLTVAIDSTVATLTGTQTLTNKTINLANNTVTGTLAQFNSAMSDGSFASLAGSETLTNKTLTSPAIDTITRTGDFTVDASGDIILDADGADIIFKDAGTEIGRVTSSSFGLKAPGTDSIVFKGNDGESDITAMSIDFSSSGDISLVGDLLFNTNKGVYFGNSANQSITSNDTNLTVSTTGDIVLDSDTDIVLDADGADVIFKDGGTEFGRISKGASSDNLIIKSAISDKDLQFKGNDGGSEITAVTFDMSEAGAATFNAGITATTGTFSGAISGTQLSINENIIFEGATANDFETTLTVTDPTADRTLTLPDETGTVATRGFAVAMAIAL